MLITRLAEFVESTGLTTGAVLAIVTAAWKLYFEPRVTAAAEAAGRLSAEKELESFRGETARALEDHKAALSLQADAVKTQFQKQITDYSIYVQRRHDAVRNLYTAVIMAKGLAYGKGTGHEEEQDHLRRLALQARDAVYAVAGAYQVNVLYLPPSVHEQFLSVQAAFVEVLEQREEQKLSVEIRPTLDRLSFKIDILAKVCREDLQSSAT